MAGSVFEEVRVGCAWVAARARHVRVAEARVGEYARRLPLERVRAPALDPRYHYLEGDVEDTVAFVLTLDAINFGSGYFPKVRKRPGLSGYFTMAASLTDRFRTGGRLSADELARLTEADCAALFGQERDDGPVDELMGLFARALNDLGRLVGERYGGSCVGLVESAGGSADQLVRLLAEMPFFRDEEAYGGRMVPFYKRAQLTAADLALALGGEGPGRFVDLDQLTIFADNLVPHVLRVDGVLRYEEELVARIAAGELIPAGSEEVVEIRAGAVHAVELLVGELRRAGHADVSAAGLDYLLWNRGQEPAYKARPRHRTRTVFY